jgi:hypothetical protein
MLVASQLLVLKPVANLKVEGKRRRIRESGPGKVPM